MNGAGGSGGMSGGVNASDMMFTQQEAALANQKPPSGGIADCCDQHVDDLCVLTIISYNSTFAELCLVTKSDDCWDVESS